LWSDVEWTMHWGERYPNKPPTEEKFEAGLALAALLAEEVVFLNSFWWEKTWPEEARKKTALCVVCNDVFAWGCADAEDLEYADIQNLWDHWKKDKTWGPAVWCMKKRGEMPQGPVLASLNPEIWNLEELKEKLKINYYDTVCKMQAEAKYKAYSEWCESKGTVPLPFDKSWQEGWKQYIAAVPNWHQLQWNEDLNQEIEKFRKEYNS